MLIPLGILAAAGAGGGGFVPVDRYVAVGADGSPQITAYPWSAGFGTKYANPAVAPGGVVSSASFSQAGDFLALASSTGSAPYGQAYAFSAAGFGTKFSPPSWPVGAGGGTSAPGRTVDFTNSGNAVAFGISRTEDPQIEAFVFPFSVSGFGTRYANPATTFNADVVHGVKFTNSGNALAVASNFTESKRISAYAWSVSGWGTRFALPATGLPNTGYRIDFTPTDNALVVAHDSSPRIAAYAWSGSGFGTKFSDPATALPNSGFGVSFSSNGSSVAAGHNNSPFISAYPWSGSGFGTKYSNPATLPAGTGKEVMFSPTGQNIAIAHDTSPFVTAYPFSAGFGTKYANPATLPGSSGQGLAFA
jgi:hypothetical protein